MINAIIKGLIKLIMSLIGVLLTPLDMLISTILPDLSMVFTAVADMFSLVGNIFGYVVYMSGLPSELLSLIALYYTFKLTAPILFSVTKMAIKWYNALKL